jgi:hypothetical protein
VDVDAVADELYTLPPGEFVASRDEKVREAKEAGDRGAARAIAALRRPTVVAWLANLLARRHPDDVAPFLELGEALRDATATLSGPELRDLSRQRHQLVHALVRTARALGEAEGQRVGEDSARGLEDTLHAALADPDAAQQLLDGRLTTGLSRAGFGDPCGIDGVSVRGFLFKVILGPKWCTAPVCGRRVPMSIFSTTFNFANAVCVNGSTGRVKVATRSYAISSFASA